MAEKSQLEEIKANIRSLIQSQTNKVYTILQLQKDYKEVMGHYLPLLGHRDVEHFLRNIPDVVNITGYGLQACLEYIPSSKSRHIGEMIKNQKQNNGRRRGNRRGNRNNCWNTEKAIPFPQYSDESDWDERTMPAASVQSQQPTNKVNIDPSLDNDGPQNDGVNTTLSESVVSEKKLNNLENPRTRILRELRKKCEQRESTTPSSSSTHSSVAANDSDDHENRTSRFRGYKYILAKIKQSEAEAIQKPNTSHLNKDTNTQTPLSRFMQLSRRSKPQKLSTPARSQINDEEEAVPASAVTELIERMGSAQVSQIATGPALSEVSIPLCNVHEKFKAGDILQLIVVEIESPLRFHFQIDEEIDEFIYLQKEIQNLYTTLARDELRMSEYNLHSGTVCAAYSDDSWYRAMICSVPQDPNEFTKIKLFLVDRGSYCELTNRHIKFLLPRFAHLPAQAICGRLANIKPKAYSKESQASQHLVKLTQSKTLYGYVKSIGTKNQQVELILLDTNVTPKRRIHEELIQAGLVEAA